MHHATRKVEYQGLFATDYERSLESVCKGLAVARLASPESVWDEVASSYEFVLRKFVELERFLPFSVTTSWNRFAWRVARKRVYYESAERERCVVEAKLLWRRY